MPGKGNERNEVTLVGCKDSFLSLLRQIAGMPNYAAHVEHLRRCHPTYPIPTQRQFYDQFIRARYGDGPTRCC